MKLTPIQKRAERKARNQSSLDMNLVSLIDVFTILIFFLLSNSGVEALPPTRAVQLPESTAEESPKETLVVVISGEEIVVGTQTVALVKDVLAAKTDLIPGLKAELDQQRAARQVVRQENAERAQAITIMGDKNIPFQLLRRVMVSCALAGFADVSFAVRQTGGA